MAFGEEQKLENSFQEFWNFSFGKLMERIGNWP